MSAPSLKFGTYAGVPLAEVRGDYLEYILSEARGTVAIVEAELERRALAAEAEMPWIRRIIESGFRTLAAKVHPDAGGNGEQMVELNAAVEALREMTR